MFTAPSGISPKRVNCVAWNGGGLRRNRSNAAKIACLARIGRAFLSCFEFDGQNQFSHLTVSSRIEGTCTPLHQAARCGHAPAVRTLLELGADVFAVSSRSGTAVHFAAMGDSVKVLSLLVNDYGADVNAVDHRSKTAVHYAAQHGRRHSMRVLVKLGAREDLV